MSVKISKYLLASFLTLTILFLSINLVTANCYVYLSTSCSATPCSNSALADGSCGNFSDSVIIPGKCQNNVDYYCKAGCCCITTGTGVDAVTRFRGACQAQSMSFFLPSEYTGTCDSWCQTTNSNFRYNITGYVFKDNTVQPGAIVTLDGGTPFVIGADGIYSFQNLVPGSHTMIASYGSCSYTMNPSVNSNNQQFNITLSCPNINLTGYILDENNNPVSLAAVNVTYNGLTKSMLSSSDIGLKGYYNFSIPYNTPNVVIIAKNSNDCRGQQTVDITTENKKINITTTCNTYNITVKVRNSTTGPTMNDASVTARTIKNTANAVDGSGNQIYTFTDLFGGLLAVSAEYTTPYSGTSTGSIRCYNSTNISLTGSSTQQSVDLWIGAGTCCNTSITRGQCVDDGNGGHQRQITTTNTGNCGNKPSFNTSTESCTARNPCQWMCTWNDCKVGDIQQTANCIQQTEQATGCDPTLSSPPPETVRSCNLLCGDGILDGNNEACDYNQNNGALAVTQSCIDTWHAKDNNIDLTYLTNNPNLMNVVCNMNDCTCGKPTVPRPIQTCSRDPGNVSLFTLNHVPEAPSFNIQWAFARGACENLVAHFELSVCNNNTGECASGYYTMLNGNISNTTTSFIHDENKSPKILPNTQYCYKLTTVFDNSVNPSSQRVDNITCITSGDSKCLGAHDNSWCLGNANYSCESNNSLVTHGCASDETCSMENNAVVCSKQPLCEQCNNIFGLFNYMESWLPTKIQIPTNANAYYTLFCPSLRYPAPSSSNTGKSSGFIFGCYKDYSMTTVDKTYSCSDVLSCYDYKSNESCIQDYCGKKLHRNGINTCQWIPYVPNGYAGYNVYGKGICAPINVSEQQCDLCKDPAYNRIGPCAPDTCRAFGDCYFEVNQTLCINRADVTCGTYQNPDECTGNQILNVDVTWKNNNNNEMDGDGKINGTNFKTQSHDGGDGILGVCRWGIISGSTDPQCFRDADNMSQVNNPIALSDDCRIANDDKLQSICEKDTVAPNTTIYNPINIGAYIDIVNKVRNNGAETGDTSLWSGWTGVTSSNPYTGTYSFTKTGDNGGGTVYSTDFIAIDPNIDYTLTGFFKSVGTGGLSTLYFGFIPYDINQHQIYNSNINTRPYYATLYNDTQTTDTVVNITNNGSTCTDWDGAKGSYGAMAFNVDDSGNYSDLPNYNVTTRNITSVVDKGPYCEVTFASAINSTYPAGTKVRLHSSGATYMYSAAQLSTVPSTWTQYSATLKGINLYGASYSSTFWPGTRYVRVLMLTNYHQDSTFVTLADNITLIAEAGRLNLSKYGLMMNLSGQILVKDNNPWALFGAPERYKNDDWPYMRLFYCIVKGSNVNDGTTCYPNETLRTIPDNAYIINLSQYGVTAADNDQSIRIFYFSEDPARNLEHPIKNFVFVVDSIPPSIEVTPTKNSYQHSENQWWTNLTMNIKLLDNPIEESLPVTCSLKVRPQQVSAMAALQFSGKEDYDIINAKLNYTAGADSVSTEYDELVDGEYYYEVNCFDLYDNLYSINNTFNITGDVRINSPTPFGQKHTTDITREQDYVIGETFTIPISINTSVNGTCSYATDPTYNVMYPFAMTSYPDNENNYYHNATISITPLTDASGVYKYYVKCNLSINGQWKPVFGTDASNPYFVIDDLAPTTKIRFENDTIPDWTDYNNESMDKITFNLLCNDSNPSLVKNNVSLDWGCNDTRYCIIEKYGAEKCLDEDKGDTTKFKSMPNKGVTLSYRDENSADKQLYGNNPTIRFYSDDNGGNVAPIVTQNLSLKNMKLEDPNITILLGVGPETAAPGDTINSPYITINLTYDGETSVNIDYISLYNTEVDAPVILEHLDGNTSRNAYRFRIKYIDNGPYTLTVSATDNDGNVKITTANFTIEHSDNTAWLKSPKVGIGQTQRYNITVDTSYYSDCRYSMDALTQSPNIASRYNDVAVYKDFTTTGSDEHTFEHDGTSGVMYVVCRTKGTMDPNKDYSYATTSFNVGYNDSNLSMNVTFIQNPKTRPDDNKIINGTYNATIIQVLTSQPAVCVINTTQDNYLLNINYDPFDGEDNNVYDRYYTVHNYTINYTGRGATPGIYYYSINCTSLTQSEAVNMSVPINFTPNTAPPIANIIPDITRLALRSFNVTCNGLCMNTYNQNTYEYALIDVNSSCADAVYNSTDYSQQIILRNTSQICVKVTDVLGRTDTDSLNVTLIQINQGDMDTNYPYAYFYEGYYDHLYAPDTVFTLSIGTKVNASCRYTLSGNLIGSGLDTLGAMYDAISPGDVFDTVWDGSVATHTITNFKVSSTIKAPQDWMIVCRVIDPNDPNPLNYTYIGRELEFYWDNTTPVYIGAEAIPPRIYDWSKRQTSSLNISTDDETRCILDLENSTLINNNNNVSEPLNFGNQNAVQLDVGDPSYYNDYLTNRQGIYNIQLKWLSNINTNNTYQFNVSCWNRAMLSQTNITSMLYDLEHNVTLNITSGIIFNSTTIPVTAVTNIISVCEATMATADGTGGQTKTMISSDGITHNANFSAISASQSMSVKCYVPDNTDIGSAYTSYYIISDASNPTVTLSSADGQDYTCGLDNGFSIYVNMSDDSGIDNYYYSISGPNVDASLNNGTPIVNNQATIQYKGVLQNNGVYTVSVRAKDLAGRYSDVENIDITARNKSSSILCDSSLPTAMITLRNSTFLDMIKANVSCSDDTGCRPEYYWSFTTNNDCSEETYTNTGSYDTELTFNNNGILCVKILDSVGNAGYGQQNITIGIDLNNPFNITGIGQIYPNVIITNTTITNITITTDVEAECRYSLVPTTNTNVSYLFDNYQPFSQIGQFKTHNLNDFDTQGLYEQYMDVICYNPALTEPYSRKIIRIVYTIDTPTINAYATPTLIYDWNNRQSLITINTNPETVCTITGNDAQNLGSGYITGNYSDALTYYTTHEKDLFFNPNTQTGTYTYAITCRSLGYNLNGHAESATSLNVTYNITTNMSIELLSPDTINNRVFDLIVQTNLISNCSLVWNNTDTGYGIDMGGMLANVTQRQHASRMSTTTDGTYAAKVTCNAPIPSSATGIQTTKTFNIIVRDSGPAVALSSKTGQSYTCGLSDGFDVNVNMTDYSGIESYNYSINGPGVSTDDAAQHIVLSGNSNDVIHYNGTLQDNGLYIVSVIAKNIVGKYSDLNTINITARNQSSSVFCDSENPVMNILLRNTTFLDMIKANVSCNDNIGCRPEYYWSFTTNETCDDASYENTGSYDTELTFNNNGILCVKGLDSAGNTGYNNKDIALGIDLSNPFNITGIGQIYPNVIITNTTITNITITTDVEAECRYGLNPTADTNVSGLFSNYQTMVQSSGNKVHTLNDFDTKGLYEQYMDVICYNPALTEPYSRKIIRIVYTIDTPTINAYATPTLIYDWNNRQSLITINTNPETVCTITGNDAQNLGSGYITGNYSDALTYYTTHEKDLFFNPNTQTGTYTYIIDCKTLGEQSNTTYVNVTYNITTNMSIELLSPDTINNRVFDLIVQTNLISNCSLIWNNTNMGGMLANVTKRQHAARISATTNGTYAAKIICDTPITGIQATNTFNIQVNGGPSAPYCGDGIINGTEKCDGNTPVGLNYMTCTSGWATVNYTGGILTCKSDCLGYDFSSCDNGHGWCGNGRLEGPNTQGTYEQCDVSVPSGLSCLDFGLKEGTLSCTKDCLVNTTNCRGANGLLSSGPYTCAVNNIHDPGEQCEAGAAFGLSCTNFGYTGGNLSCSSCRFSMASCYFNTNQTPSGSYCGNSIKEGSEQCDNSSGLSTVSCRTLGNFSSGNVSCTRDCKYNLSRCISNVTSCTNGRKDITEADIDCGGNCNPCGLNKTCFNNTDCASNKCTLNKCAAVANTCNNTIFDNNSESDVDCGKDCTPCALNKNCSVNADCISDVCTDGKCSVDICSNSVKDSDNGESDVDCGGNCTLCEVGKSCNANSDCGSENCIDNICAEPKPATNPVKVPLLIISLVFMLGGGGYIIYKTFIEKKPVSGSGTSGTSSMNTPTSMMPVRPAKLTPEQEMKIREAVLKRRQGRADERKNVLQRLDESLLGEKGKDSEDKDFDSKDSKSDLKTIELKKTGRNLDQNKDEEGFVDLSKVKNNKESGDKDTFSKLKDIGKNEDKAFDKLQSFKMDNVSKKISQISGTPQEDVKPALSKTSELEYPDAIKLFGKVDRDIIMSGVFREILSQLLESGKITKEHVSNILFEYMDKGIINKGDVAKISSELKII